MSAVVYLYLTTMNIQVNYMIGYLQGSIQHIGESNIILLVSGVGYEIEVNDILLHKLTMATKELQLYIYHHVREDQQSLFGFSSIREKDLFKMLLKVNGVGPKLALAIFSGLDANALVNAVLSEDYTTLKQVKGLGIKVAKRLVMDLKTPFSVFANSGLIGTESDNSSSEWQDAVLVLTRLGYKTSIAEKVVLACKADADDLDHLIRLSLKYISTETTGSQ